MMVMPCDVQMPAICLELACCELPEKVLLEVMRGSFLGDLCYRNRIVVVEEDVRQPCKLVFALQCLLT